MKMFISEDLSCIFFSRDQLKVAKGCNGMIVVDLVIVILKSEPQSGRFLLGRRYC